MSQAFGRYIARRTRRTWAERKRRQEIRFRPYGFLRERSSLGSTLRRSHRDLYAAVVAIDCGYGDGAAPDAGDLFEDLAALVGVEAAAVGGVVVEEFEFAVDVNMRCADGGSAEAVLRSEQ